VMRWQLADSAGAFAWLANHPDLLDSAPAQPTQPTLFD
jgi:hypothetical protein